MKLESFKCRATAYYPDDSPLEGGFKDRHGKPLGTLQGFLEGRHEYVACAMDVPAFPYGTRLCMPELNEYYNRQIDFRVVDTGGAFRNKGRNRIDICVENQDASYHGLVNKTLTIVAMVE